MSKCILCDLVTNRIPVSSVYEDSNILALLDIYPATTGHTIVIPKQHATCLAELDEAVGAQLFKVTMRITESVRNSGVKCEGITLCLADGEAAGQEIFHTHMHVIPRYKGDNVRMKIGQRQNSTREELDRIAQRIKAAYLS